MTKLPFPFSYFANIVTPRRVFLGRKSLTKFQLVVIFIFITALALIPVTVNMARSTNFQLAEIMPDMFKQVDHDTLMTIQAAGFKDGQLAVEGSQMINSRGTIGVNLSEDQFKSVKSGISFGETAMILKDASGYEFKVSYTKDFNPQDFTTVEELKQGISSQWLKQNKAFVAFTMMLMSASLILVSNVILIVGGGFFVWLTKKNHLSSIKTYQESLNLVLNGLGLSTMLGMVVGLISFDMTLVLSIQSFGLVLMLLGVFVTTRFNDSYAKSKVSKLQRA
ncbi:DUF1189 domain-containing protein [Vagococcus sp. BWB3-3]|uniref:DUF1189 domain-containing protein n=1 Tax=Vagococcus allomyrinae TaxID=2794353 RepID=A0A940P3F6_9ENTE|nr:DUF1189 domain-containing protein [Vagococcus allomyrinae]MBP1040747.1 DUF1189 domain-containing protein [Vagococcus allomyrinae]